MPKVHQACTQGSNSGIRQCLNVLKTCGSRGALLWFQVKPKLNTRSLLNIMIQGSNGSAGIHYTMFELHLQVMPIKSLPLIVSYNGSLFVHFC